MVTREELTQLANKIDSFKEQQIRLETQYKEVLSRLKEYGYDSVEEAEIGIEKQKLLLIKEEAELDTAYSNFKQKYPGLFA